MTFNFNKIEYMSHKEAFSQVWMKLALWFWRGRKLDALLRYYLSSKRRGPLLIKLEFPSPLCQVWLMLLRGFGEEDKNVKSLQTDGRTDRRTDVGTTDTRGSEKHRSGKLAIITIPNSAINFIITFSQILPAVILQW